MISNQYVQPAVVMNEVPEDLNRQPIRLALFDENGNAISFEGSAEPTPVAWDDITDKPEVIGAGATAAAARSAIGAGTSSVSVGSTAGSALAASGAAGSSAQAARADHVHPFPTAANVGAAATSHTHTGSQVTLTGYTSGSAGNVAASDTVNAAIAKLEARLAALESV